jgi:hypothetical protein
MSSTEQYSKIMNTDPDQLTNTELKTNDREIDRHKSSLNEQYAKSPKEIEKATKERSNNLHGPHQKGACCLLTCINF